MAGMYARTIGVSVRHTIALAGVALVVALVGSATMPSGMPLLKAAAPAEAEAGNREWWGYRTNSWETWALATQSPDFTRTRIPYFGHAVYVMATSWRYNAQSARRVGMCTGITWSASPIFVGCSRY
jgi:hypothetical protein